MPRVNYDMTNAEPIGSGGGFTALPPEQGPYVLRVVKVTNEKSKRGNAMLVFDFEVVENHAEGDAEYQDMAGRTFRQWYSLIDRQPMVGRMLALANVCEVPYDRQGFDTDDFLDAVFECDLTIETTDQGGEFNRIENPRPAATEGGEEAKDAEGPGEDANPPEEPPAAPAPRRAPNRATTRAPSPPRRNVR